MSHHTFFLIIGKDVKNVSSAAVVNGALRVKVQVGMCKNLNKSAHSHCLVSLSFMHEETLNHWLCIKRPSKALIRLRGFHLVPFAEN